MTDRKSIFLYPITKEQLKEGSNTYVRSLITCLSENFIIVNHPTEIGLLDAVAKFRKTDIYYFNWIEDVPTKRFGILQVVLFFFLTVLCKLTGRKLVWFVHNNISHNKRFLFLKKVIIRWMAIFADLILSHSCEINLHVPEKKLKIFHHPIDGYHPIKNDGLYSYDLLIWGNVSPYKGILEFVDFVASSDPLRKLKIMIAGKFHSEEYLNSIVNSKSENINILNKILTEEELTSIFSQSRYVLFTYKHASVLSSAALCKSLSYGKEVIGPNVGSFKELGKQNLVFTYDTFSSLEDFLSNSTSGYFKIDQNALCNYIHETSWPAFADFLTENIYQLYTKRAFTFQ